jgi:histidine triad (HIT) family protein
MACIFCEIVARRAPASIVYEDDETMAFKDIHPQAPMHVLVIPKLHIATVNDLEEHHIALMGKLFLVVKHLAAQWNIVAQGYRLRVHVGRGGGQLIDHIHMHLLSGRQHGA